MKRFNDSKMTLLLLVLMLALMFTAATAKADFIFGKPQNLGPTVNSPYHEAGPCFSADGLAASVAGTSG